MKNVLNLSKSPIALATVVAGALLATVAGAQPPAKPAKPGKPAKVAPAKAAPVKAAPAGTPVAAEPLETNKIHDLVATLVVNNDETNFDELKKIGGAFATTYRVKRVEVTYANPNKTRFESRLLGAPVVMIYNGTKKAYKTPIKSGASDVSDQPGQKQSLLDLGIFARDYLQTDYEPQFVRREGGLIVYKLVQRGTTNHSHEIVWLNPKTALIERRQSFSGDNVLKKELRYKLPQQVRPGIWIPTRIEIYNQFGKLGAVQTVEGIKVNLGVDESKFDVS